MAAEESYMTVTAIGMNPNFQPSDQTLTAVDLAYAASTGFAANAAIDRAESADLCRLPVFVMLVIEWIRSGQVIPVLHLETGIVAFESVSSVLKKKEIPPYLQQLAGITGRSDSEEKYDRRVDWRCRNGLTKADRRSITLAARRGGLNDDEIKSLIFLLDRHHRELKVVFDVVRGDAYLMRGEHGQLLFRPVDELTEENRELLLQKRAFAGLSPTSTIEMKPRQQTA
jgi:hypothetical protein